MVAFVVVSFRHVATGKVALGMALRLTGSFNGFLITTGGVPPIIATLGTLSIYRGLILSHSQGHDGSIPYEMPESFRALAKAHRSVYQHHPDRRFSRRDHLHFSTTRPGRDIYTIGSNPDAARVAGINVTRTTFMVYVVSGLLCGLAAVLWASRF